MDTLNDMAQEYLKNALRMEAHIVQLESQASRTISLEVRRKLRRRINAMRKMVMEGRETAFLLEHYYDKPEERSIHVTVRPKRGRPKKTKFNSSGYGAASPALVMHGRNADKAAVSGVRTQLSRRHDPERHRCRI